MIQDKFNKKNMIYKITKDIDLEGETLVILTGCTIDFQGGKILNGVIELNNTKILPNGSLIKDYITAKINGTYCIGQCLYDDNINKPIWWTGTKWTDANGQEVQHE